MICIFAQIQSHNDAEYKLCDITGFGCLYNLNFVPFCQSDVSKFLLTCIKMLYFDLSLVNNIENPAQVLPGKRLHPPPGGTIAVTRTPLPGGATPVATQSCIGIF